jgi:hypothetical protein
VCVCVHMSMHFLKLMYTEGEIVVVMIDLHASQSSAPV